MINDPTSHKTARFLVVLVLVGAFALITTLHLGRFGNRMFTVQEEFVSDVLGVGLPGFQVEPLDNRTRFMTFECASGASASISPYSIKSQLVPYTREDLAAAWQKYQELKAKSPSASIDELLAQMNLQNSGWWTNDLRAMLTNDSVFQQDMEGQRWSRYMVMPESSNSSDSQPSPVTRKGITCRISGFQEISAENATVTTPTVVREVGGNGTSVPMGSVDPSAYGSSAVRNIPFFMNQQLVLTYLPVRECRRYVPCFLCAEVTHCHLDYQLNSKELQPVANGALLPRPFQNASSPAAMANYAYVTVQLNSPSYYRDPEVLQRTRVGVYNNLDFATALFAAICFLMLVYTLLMGDFRVSPFGWVQRFVLFSSRKRYVEQVEAEAAKEDQPLERVLFSMYLNGSQLESRRRGGL